MFLQLPFCKHCQSLESLINTVPTTNIEKNDADCGQEQERNTRPFLNFCEKCNCGSPSAPKVCIPPYTPCFLLAVPLQSVLPSASQSSVGTQTDEECDNKNCCATDPVKVQSNDCIQEESKYPIFSGELLSRAEPNLLEFSQGFHSILHDKNKRAKAHMSDGMPLSNDNELNKVYESDKHNMMSSSSSSSYMQEIISATGELQEEDMSISIDNSRALEQENEGSEYNEGPSSILNLTTDLDNALEDDSYEEYERIKTKGFTLASCLDYLAKRTYLYIDQRYEIRDRGDGENINCDGKLDFLLQHCIVQKEEDSNINVTRSYSVNSDEIISPLYTDSESLHCKGDYYWHEDSSENSIAYFCQDENNTSPEQFESVNAYDSNGYHRDDQLHATSDNLNEAPEFYPYPQFRRDIKPRYSSKALHDNYFQFLRDTNSLSTEGGTADVAINLEPNLSKEFESKSNDICL